MDDYIRKVDECEEHDDVLLDWERSFLAAMSSWASKGREFSPKQKEFIDQIWTRVTEETR